jgi:hypothetical protein
MSMQLPWVEFTFERLCKVCSPTTACGRRARLYSPTADEAHTTSPGTRDIWIFVSTSSPWSPFAPRESLSPTSEAVAWKRGALFLANPPPDEFVHIDEFGNEKSWYAKTNWNTTERTRLVVRLSNGEARRGNTDGEEC